MEIILSFLIIFMISIKNIYVVNIVWCALFLFLLYKKRIKMINCAGIKIYILFFIWGIFSIVLYNSFCYEFSFRQIFSLVFTLQYLFWFMEIKLDRDKLYKWIINWALVMSVYIFYIFFKNGYYKYIQYWTGLIRNWGVEDIPGFPTYVIIPMSFAVFLAFYCKKKPSTKIILSIATFIIPSRAGQVAVIIIWLYYIMRAKSKKSFFMIMLSLLAGSLGIILFYPKVQEFMAALGVRYKAGANEDRMDIIRVCMEYFVKSPIIGYGGNTLDTLTELYGNNSGIGSIWAHTHNWFLEMLIRYGAVGCGCFLILLLYLLKRIKDKQILFFVILLLGLGLLQTYMQNFVYVFIIMSLVSFTNNQRETKNGT